MNKKEVRNYMTELKRNLSTSQIQEYSKAIRECLLNETSFINCTHLFCYVAFNQEVLTNDIINLALSRNIKVAVPKIIDNEMKFYEINSLNGLQTNSYGILEPVTNNTSIMEAVPKLNQNNLVIVPGLAFDKNKNRIGYGKGYYDSFFHKYKYIPMQKIALTFDFQVVNQLPADEFDIKVDKIITNTQIIN